MDPILHAIHVELTPGTRVRRRADGSVRYAGWLPFAYGHLPGIRAADGADADVVVLGHPASVGEVIALPIWGAVAFIDDGCVDDKWVASPTPPSRATRGGLLVWFRAFALAKRLGRLGRGGPTRCLGWRPGGP